MHLYEVLAGRVAEWRKQRHSHPRYPAIGEILEWAANPEGAGSRPRPPQVRPNVHRWGRARRWHSSSGSRSVLMACRTSQSLAAAIRSATTRCNPSSGL